MSVHNNCYVYRSNDKEILITMSKINSITLKSKECIYAMDREGLKSIQDKKGNYYYLDDSCREMQ